MYAVIKTGGKQYKVNAGDEVKLERLEGEAGDSVTFDRVLLTSDGENVKPWFQQQFEGLNLKDKIRILKKGDWNPELKESFLKENAITSITGATITSKAVITSLQDGINRLHRAIEKNNKKEAAGGNDK